MLVFDFYVQIGFLLIWDFLRVKMLLSILCTLDFFLSFPRLVATISGTYQNAIESKGCHGHEQDARDFFSLYMGIGGYPRLESREAGGDRNGRRRHFEGIILVIGLQPLEDS